MIKKNFKKKSKVLIFMLAYNAEKTISETIKRLPLSDKNYDLEILIVDDPSSDNTWEPKEDQTDDHYKKRLPFGMSIEKEES